MLKRTVKRLASLRLRQRWLPVRTADGRKLVYLVFDDGPVHGYTDEVLACLQAAGAHATFFQCSGMQDYPEAPGMLLAAGHQIGTHTWNHVRLAAAAGSPAGVIEREIREISQARDYQVKLTGHDSRLFRFPHDTPTKPALDYLAAEGMRWVRGNVVPGDWDAGLPDAQLVRNVTAVVFPGAVVDLHDGHDTLRRGHPTYLPALLDQLSALGYIFGTVPSRDERGG